MVAVTMANLWLQYVVKICLYIILYKYACTYAIFLAFTVIGFGVVSVVINAVWPS